MIDCFICGAELDDAKWCDNCNDDDFTVDETRYDHLPEDV